MADDVISLKINLEANTANMTLQELEDHFEAMKTKLKGIGRGDAEFQKLSNAMARTTAEIKNIEIGFEGLDRTQIASELGAVAGGISAITASLILMGGESENMRQMGQSIQAALAITMGVKGAIEAGTAANKLYTNSVKAQAIATKGAAFMQGILNAVMSLNPIGLIVIALGLAVAAIVYFKDAIWGLINSALAQFQFAIDAVVDALQWLGIMESDSAKATKKAEDEKARAAVESAEKRVKANEELIKSHQKLTASMVADMDFEIRKRKANGEDTGKLEKEKIQFLIDSAKKEAKLQEQRLIDLDNEFKARVRAGKVGPATAFKMLKAKTEATKGIIKANEEQLASEQDLEIITIEAQKKIDDDAKKSSADSKAQKEKDKADESKRLIEEAKTLAEFEEEQARIKIQLIQDEGERKRAEIKYNSELELEALEKKGQDTFDARMLIAQTKNKALADLEKEEEDKRFALEKEAQAKRDEYDKLLFDAKVANEQEETEKKKLQLEEDYQNNITRLEEEGLLTMELEFELAYAREQALADIEEEFREKKKAADIEMANMTMDLAVQTLSEISSVSGAYADADLKAEEERFSNLRATKQLTEKQLAAEELKTSQIKDAIRKKQFEREKKLNIAMALINGAQAQMSILAQTPKADFGIATAILMASAAIATAASIAKIKSTTFSSTPSAALPTLPSGDVSPTGPDAGAGAQINAVTNTSTILGNQQVYVTETDITTTQNNVSVIEESATF